MEIYIIQIMKGLLHIGGLS